MEPSALPAFSRAQRREFGAELRGVGGGHGGHGGDAPSAMPATSQDGQENFLNMEYPLVAVRTRT